MPQLRRQSSSLKQRLAQAKTRFTALPGKMIVHMTASTTAPSPSLSAAHMTAGDGIGVAAQSDMIPALRGNAVSATPGNLLRGSTPAVTPHTASSSMPPVPSGPQVSGVFLRPTALLMGMSTVCCVQVYAQCAHLPMQPCMATGALQCIPNCFSCLSQLHKWQWQIPLL